MDSLRISIVSCFGTLIWPFLMMCARIPVFYLDMCDPYEDCIYNFLNVQSLTSMCVFHLEDLIKSLFIEMILMCATLATFLRANELQFPSENAYLQSKFSNEKLSTFGCIIMKQVTKVSSGFHT